MDVPQILTKNLTPSDINEISACIADTIYETAHTRTVYENTERLNALVLLQKCHLSHVNHLEVNFTNRSCFVNVFKQPSCDNKHEQLPPLDISKTIMEYYERLHHLKEQNQKKLEMIQEYDRRTCQIPDYNFKPRQNVSNCLEDLKLIQVEQDVKHTETASSPSRHYTVSLAYALLNFKDATSNNLLLDILQSWNCSEQLQPDQIAFVNHLWKNVDVLNENVFEFILENFKFVMEKDVINACANLLIDNSNYELPSNVQKIFEYCLDNKKLSCVVKNLLYTLYRCSGFNETVLELINKLQI